MAQSRLIVLLSALSTGWGCQAEVAGGTGVEPPQAATSGPTGSDAPEAAEEGTSGSPPSTSGAGASSTGDDGIKLDVGDPTAGADDIPPIPPPLPFPVTCEEAAEIPSSVGCEFVVLLPPNGDEPVRDTGFIISNVSDQPAHVVLEDAMGVLAEVDVEPGASEMTLVDATHLLRWETSRSLDGLRFTSDQVLQIFSASPPTPAANNDASLVLPTNGLGKRHRVGVYPGAEGIANFNVQYMAFVAVQDATTVSVRLHGSSTMTFGGEDLPALDVPAGVDSLTLELDALETVVIAAPVNGLPLNDLSGSIVDADGPIGMYTGTSALYMPGANSAAVRCCADLLTEQVPPTSAWGWRYAGVKFRPLGVESDVWRFIADHDDTRVRLTGGVDDEFLLDAGEIAEVSTDQNFLIESSQPVGVLHFMSSTSEASAPMQPEDYVVDTPDCGPLAAPGDPAMSWVYPRGNWLSRYAFTVDISPGHQWCDDHVTVVAATEAWDEIMHNGEPLPPPSPLADGELSFAYVSTPEGTHAFVAPEGVGFEVTAYGVGYAGSYVFSGGVGLRDLQAEG